MVPSLQLEPVIVYQDLDEQYIDEAQESSSFCSALETVTEHATLMTQDYGGELRVLRGEFNSDNDLPRLLRCGIELPQNPPDDIMLTEGMEPEILTMAISDIWGEKALDHDEGVTVTRNEVRDYFAPRHNVPLDDLDVVFSFLQEFGACGSVEGQSHTYKFEREHVPAILGVESHVMDNPFGD
jgi:hypothetical protein